MYSRKKIYPAGEISTLVNSQQLTFQVMHHGGLIFGKNAFESLKIVARIGTVFREAEINIENRHEANNNSNSPAENMVNEYYNVFSGLGMIKCNLVIHIDKNIVWGKPNVVDQ